MARKNHADGRSYEAETKGEPLPPVAYGEGLDLAASRLLAAAGGHPGQRDSSAAPFGRGSTPADLPSGGNTWAAPSGAG